jgi:ATP-dependent exoDNAse (exonuclease V) beta subunit
MLVRKPIPHDAYVKYAQLRNMQIPNFSCTLFDETQDASACQLDLFVTQQVSNPPDGIENSVFVVADTVQLYRKSYISIYTFRGARSKIIQTLAYPVDFKLTHTFRFQGT